MVFRQYRPPAPISSSKQGVKPLCSLKPVGVKTKKKKKLGKKARKEKTKELRRACWILTDPGATCINSQGWHGTVRVLQGRYAERELKTWKAHNWNRVAVVDMDSDQGALFEVLGMT